jgi:hypothetical protein
MCYLNNISISFVPSFLGARFLCLKFIDVAKRSAWFWLRMFRICQIWLYLAFYSFFCEQLFKYFKFQWIFEERFSIFRAQFHHLRSTICRSLSLIAFKFLTGTEDIVSLVFKKTMKDPKLFLPVFFLFDDI